MGSGTTRLAGFSSCAGGSGFSGGSGSAATGSGSGGAGGGPGAGAAAFAECGAAAGAEGLSAAFSADSSAGVWATFSCDPSVCRNRSASGPSRMLALRLLTLEHLLGERPIRLGRLALGFVAQYRLALDRRLGVANRLADARPEHELAEVLLEDLDGLAHVQRTRVVHRRKDPDDLHARVQVLADSSQSMFELHQSAQRKVFAL